MRPFRSVGAAGKRAARSQSHRLVALPQRARECQVRCGGALRTLDQALRRCARVIAATWRNVRRLDRGLSSTLARPRPVLAHALRQPWREAQAGGNFCGLVRNETKTARFVAGRTGRSQLTANSEAGERARLGRSERRPRRSHHTRRPSYDKCVWTLQCSARGRAEQQPGRLRSPSLPRSPLEKLVLRGRINLRWFE